MSLQRIEEGRNIFLRKPVSGDKNQFLSSVRKSNGIHRPWVSPPNSSGKFSEYLNRSRKKGFCFFLLCRQSDGAIVGVINMSQIFMGNFRSAYLGYYVFSNFIRLGFMREGMQLVLRFAFKKMKLHRLEANVQPRNKNSISLIRRCGFHKEGFSPRYLKISGKWCDHERWAITLEDWQKNKK